MRAGLLIVTPPATEPISTADAKAFLRVDHADEDTLIDALVTTARRFVENYTGRALITQTWAQWLDRFPDHGKHTQWWDGTREGPVSMLNPPDARRLSLFRAPVVSLTSIKTYAPDDTEATFDAASYILDDSQEIPQVVLRDGYTWPVNLRVAKAIKIEFVAGYGDADDVPADMILAMKQLVAHWYENREAASENAMSEIPLGAKLLLDAYRVVDL